MIPHPLIGTWIGKILPPVGKDNIKNSIDHVSLARNFFFPPYIDHCKNV